MSIHDASHKIKAYFDSENGHTAMLIIILVAVAIGSFGLGMTLRPNGTPEVKIVSNPGLVVASAEDYKTNKAPSPQSATALTGTSGGAYVASKRGKKYYPVGCSAAKSLSAANKIYFATADEAEGKGYSLSTSCH